MNDSQRTDQLTRAAPRRERVAVDDAERRPQTAGVELANRAELEDVISREELEEIAQSYKRTAGFEPEALNDRPLSVGRRSADRAGSRGHGHEPVHA